MYGPGTWASPRARLVTPAVAVRSASSTTAMVYDWRAGTSIDESADRRTWSRAQISKLGTTAIAIRNTLDGMWVNTIVLISPIRPASHAATGNDAVVSSPETKKIAPICAGWAAKRVAKK